MKVSNFLNFWKYISRFFMSGIVILVPLIITIAIIWWAISLINSLLWIDSFINDLVVIILSVTGLSASWKSIIWYTCIILFIIILWAFKEKQWFGQRVEAKIKGFFHKVPIINKLYAAAEQITQYFIQPTEGLSRFWDVVMVDIWKGKVLWLIWPKPEIVMDSNKYLWVFIPTAPVPATWYNYLASIESVYYCDQVTIDIFAKANISLWILTQEFTEQELKLIPYSKVKKNW